MMFILSLVVLKPLRCLHKSFYFSTKESWWLLWCIDVWCMTPRVVHLPIQYRSLLVSKDSWAVGSASSATATSPLGHQASLGVHNPTAQCGNMHHSGQEISCFGQRSIFPLFESLLGCQDRAGNFTRLVWITRDRRNRSRWPASKVRYWKHCEAQHGGSKHPERPGSFIISSSIDDEGECCKNDTATATKPWT